MPSTAVKELYVAKSMEDLESGTACDIKGRPTHLLISSAGKVFQSAEISYLDKDEERAYVQYMRFVEIVLTLKKRSDFSKDKNRKRLLESANTAISKAELLKESLKKRYSILEEAICREKNAKNSIITELQSKPIIAEDFSEVPVEADSKDVEKLSITSHELHSLFTSSTQSSIIIMDVRSAEDFEKSHIKHSRCINIPQEILRPGLTAATLESMLPKDSLTQWFKRKEADYIILIDWDSKDENSESINLNALKSAMCKWDPTCVFKRTPVVLKGGYKDWMVKYPMYTTQALNFDSLNDMKTSLMVTDLSAIQYPDLDENVLDNSKISNENSNNILFKRCPLPSTVLNETSPHSTVLEGRKLNSAPIVDRKTKPSISIGPKSAVSENKFNRNVNLNDDIVLQEKKMLPTVDRKLKNTVLASDKNGATKTHLLDSLNKEQSLAKETVEIAKQQLKNEEEFEKLCLRKELEAEESKRIEIQKQEEILIQRLKQLELQSDEKEIALQKLRDENLKMKKLMEERMDEEVKREKEKEIARSLKEQAALRENVERLREERKKKDAENQKRRELSGAVSRESASANSALKRINLSDKTASNSPSSSSESTVPLSRQVSSDNSSRGLTRSHSSPNIAQMMNEEGKASFKIPVIDRSLKPKTPGNSQQNELKRARTRNLNPVYGNCPARPATGLRNLGNTCFMNSVIQCLSHTIPLAEYFNSGQYLEHINRDNKQGTGGELAEEFAVVIKSLWMGQYKSFYPKDFKNIVSRCLPVCIGNEQQDSHEFLVVLMEKLHADLNKKYTKTPPALDSNVSENTFWHHHKTYHSSKISEIFEGLLKSTLTCLSCRKTSDSFEAFSCLSLPILTSRCSLKECFQHFLRPEKISGEAAWDCPRCKQKKEAEKRLRICRLPDVLIIQLKRFSYEGLWRRKLQTHVDFDIFNFDVSFEENPHSRVYSLYGIVNHYGTLEGGHYIAYCKTPSMKWFKYDDHEVSEISSSDIKTSAAYMLFYIATDFHSKL